MNRQIVMLLAVLLLFTSSAMAKTLMLEGNLNSSIAMRQQMEFAVDQGTVQSFTFRFALPAEYSTKSVRQSVDSITTSFDPRPDSSVVERDRFGNRFQKVSWSNVRESIRINLGYNASIQSELSAMESRSPFPIRSVSSAETLFLQSTEMVQSDSDEIATLARRLTSSARSEYEAVTAITNYVSNTIKYTFNPPKYDALYTLSTRSGNCQNLAHLNIALLRSIGIPARIVGGVTLKESWKVPIDSRNSIVQSIGQGGHAWMEIYFPDLGWLSYDPQQSRQFTSTRHIKQTHGLDSRDINDTWRGAPYLPRYSELVEGSFLNDDIKLKVKKTGANPRAYIISNLFVAKAIVDDSRPNRPPVKPDDSVVPPLTPGMDSQPPEPAANDVPPVQTDPEQAAQDRPEYVADDEIVLKKPAKVVKKPPVKISKPVRKKPITRKTVRKPVVAKVEPNRPKLKRPFSGSTVVFGNMEFPNLVNAYSVQGNTGTRILDKETSEYVTSQHIFAQAFNLKSGIALGKVSLAMRKFGGDGMVYVDLVQDDGNNRPKILSGIRSNPVALDKISRKPGYYWVDFLFPADSQNRLKPGKYWIVFRYSGEAIMNWFYIPGKPYGDGDDTRSTAKGFQWEDILNYDFVFKVYGKAI